MYDRSRFYGRDGRDCPSGDWMDRYAARRTTAASAGRPVQPAPPARPGRAVFAANAVRWDRAAQRARPVPPDPPAGLPADGTHWSYRFDRSYRNGLLRKVNYL